MRPPQHAIALVLVVMVALSACTTPHTPPAGSDGAVDSQRPSDSPNRSPAQTPTPTARAPVLVEDRIYVFPVAGDASYGPVHHDYPATDIFADCGTPVVAPVSGVVSGVDRTDRYAPTRDDPAARGGRSWTVIGDDGVRYYGSHLQTIDPSITPGTWLRAGQRIGRVGESGNAAGAGCHLHFGVSPVCGRNGDWWVRRGVVPTSPYLRAWENGHHRAPVGEVGRWKRANGCPPEPPE